MNKTQRGCLDTITSSLEGMWKPRPDSEWAMGRNSKKSTRVVRQNVQEVGVLGEREIGQ